MNRRSKLEQKYGRDADQQGGEDRGPKVDVKSSEINGMLSTPSALRSLPSVAMGIATLRGYRMTSSHSSKDPLRPPVSEGQSVTTANAITHFLSLGRVPRRGERVDKREIGKQHYEQDRDRKADGRGHDTPLLQGEEA